MSTGALLAGDLSHPSVPYGVLAAAAVAVVGPTVGTRGMRRASLWGQGTARDAAGASRALSV
ncbi:hypothetical protein [Streptosporangium roseum]|uniref:hypothetical protein n=1 Tax=Streptosporangium roseum TaxID=2001 RepID=UPI003329DA20